MIQAIRDLIALEPVRVRAVASALIGLGLALGLNLDSDGILGVLDTVLPWITAAVIMWRTRGRVTPVTNPTVPAGTTVNIEGTDRSIVVGG